MIDDDTMMMSNGGGDDAMTMLVVGSRMKGFHGNPKQQGMDVCGGHARVISMMFLLSVEGGERCGGLCSRICGIGYLQIEAYIHATYMMTTADEHCYRHDGYRHDELENCISFTIDDELCL